MRNIAEIIKDDRKGKELSQKERQIAIAYNQGKYDAVRELKIANNSNINDVLDKIRAEIEKAVWEDVVVSLDGTDKVRIPRLEPDDVFEIIDKYKRESEG